MDIKNEIAKNDLIEAKIDAQRKIIKNTLGKKNTEQEIFHRVLGEDTP